jgi:surface protein
MNTIILSSITAQNGTFINFINYSGIEYNIITDGPTSNYLSTSTILTTFYTNVNNLNKWLAPSYYRLQQQESMILNISTLPGNYTLSLPFGGISSLTIDWGDGTTLSYTTTPIQHTYLTLSKFPININGYATSFGNIAGYTGSTLISTVTQWGKIGLTSLQGAFTNAINLVSVPSTISQYITNTSYMFANTSSFNSDISYWNTSNITNMNNMFKGASSFNVDISPWNTLNVTDMSYMFSNAVSFNNNISPWNTLSVTNMSYMFNDAISFNIDISIWNTSSVTNMSNMFNGAIIFNQNIGSWSTSNVTDMSYMFSNAVSFNSNIGSWSTNKVTNMSYMFSGATTFNIDISSWSTSSTTNMSYMFNGAQSFNQDISIWNMSNVTNIIRMFNNASFFNQSLSNWIAPLVLSPNANNIFCNCNGMLSRPISNYPTFGYVPIWGC